MLISNMTLAFENFELKLLNVGIFGQAKSVDLLIFAIFCMYPISNVLISDMILVSENVKSKFPNMGILSQIVSPS